MITLLEERPNTLYTHSLDWVMTFPSTVEGKGSNTDFFNIYGLFDATQGQSRCSAHTPQITQPFECKKIVFCLEITFSCSKVAHHWEEY